MEQQPTITGWKQKALALFPDLRPDLEEPDANIYTLFFELLPRCIEAHEAGNTEELTKIYGFAEWCSHQGEKNLWNAAGVAFYEHLVDEPITREQIPLWLSSDVFEGASPLFEWRLGWEDFLILKNDYEKRHKADEG